MAAQPHDEVTFEKWQFGSVVSTGKNARCIPVNDGIGFPATHPKIQLCMDHDPALEIVQVRQEGESRCMIVKVPEESPLSHSLLKLDQFALTAAESMSVEIFKKQFRPEQLTQLYRPVLKDGLLTLTINEDVQVWKLLDDTSGDGPDKNFCDASLEELTPGDKVWICAEVKALYFLPRSFGVALVASDVLVIPSTKAKVFPFVSRTRRFTYSVPIAAHAASSSFMEEQDEASE